MNIAKWLTGAAFLAATDCMPPGPTSGSEAAKSLERGSYSVPQLGDLRVSYLRVGARGGRRVVFVHGTPGDAEGWRDFLLNVPPNFEYVAIDRPGFGATMPRTAESSLARQAAALTPLLVERQGRKAILVGHSLGGPIVARAAADHPGQVGGLLILAGALDPALERIHPLQPVGEWWGIRSLLPRQMRNANLELLPLKGELERLAPLLSRVRAPVTIVHGTADRLVPVANVRFMQAHFTGAAAVRTILLPGESHFLPWEHRPEVERALLDLAGE